MSDHPEYEVVVVGGGPAGLTTALYTTRLGHRTAVFEKEGGRHTAVSQVHNLPGVSEEVSGSQLAELAVSQLEEYGCDFYPDVVDDVRPVDERSDGVTPAAADSTGAAESSDETPERPDGVAGGSDPRFVVEATHGTVTTDRIVFATGFRDIPPAVPDLRRYTGRGLHYCLHCDAYTLGDAPVFVLGHDEHAAEVAMLMLNFTADVDLLLDGREPEWDEETNRLVRGHPVECIDREVIGAFPEDGGNGDVNSAPWLGGLTFADGAEREYLGGFAMYGTEYNAALPESLGCDLTDEGAVAVDERGETSLAGAYAVGDVTHGQNQTTIAIGDGARAGIALHKDLRRFPLSAEELEAASAAEFEGARDCRGAESPALELDLPGVPPDVRARMRRDRIRDTHAGLREPRPDR